MNILFVINSIEPGGAEVFLLRFAKALKEKEHGVFVLPIRPEQSNPDFLQLFIDAKISILSTNKESTPLKEKLFWKINALCSKIGMNGVYVRLKQWDKKIFYQRLLKEHNIQIINSHLFDADNFAVNYLKKISGLPVVLTMHSSYNEVAINKHKNPEQFIQKAGELLNNANFITYLTDDNKFIFDLIPSKLQTPTQKIYLGYKKPVINQSTLELSKNKFTFGMIARGIKEKGWQEVITAFEKLQESNDDISLYLLCPETDYMKGLKDKYAHNHAIVFKGYVSKPEEYLAIFDICLLPSYYPESLPVTIIESLAFGVPVIASNVGEIPHMLATESGEIAGDILSLNEEGIVSVADLVPMMNKYLKNPKLMEHKKICALNAAQKFSMELCLKQYLSIFSSLKPL